MPDPTAQPSPSPDPSTSAWLLAGAELRAILADDALLEALRAGERPDEDDPDPLARVLSAWLAEVGAPSAPRTVTR